MTAFTIMAGAKDVKRPTISIEAETRGIMLTESSTDTQSRMCPSESWLPDSWLTNSFVTEGEILPYYPGMV